MPLLSSVHLTDLCLKDPMSVADSLYNLQLIQDFCDGCLHSCCPLALEDLLYTPPPLQVQDCIACSIMYPKGTLCITVIYCSMQ